jgi:SAM-dependent methyltransferase
MQAEQETIIQDEQVTSKSVIRAEDVAFGVVAKLVTQNIQNIDIQEETLLNITIPIIESCKNLLKKFSSIQYNDINYKIFEKEYWAHIDQLELVFLDSNYHKYKNKIQNIFRGEIFNYYTQSLLVSRAYGKPFGYPGDYLLLQALYDNKLISHTNTGKYYDKMYLEDPLSTAVVSRVNAMANRLSDFINKSQELELNILNIASGSGFDLITVAKTRHNKTVNIYCFDQELFSLQYIKSKIKAININTNFIFIKEDIRKFFKKWNNAIKFDLIYNIGLADYLPDRMLRSLMQESINTLKENGRFILSHKDYTKFPYQYPSWTCNWNFFKRSLRDYKKFIDENLTNFQNYDIFYASNKKVIYFGEFIK